MVKTFEVCLNTKSLRLLLLMAVREFNATNAKQHLESLALMIIDSIKVKYILYNFETGKNEFEPLDYHEQLRQRMETVREDDFPCLDCPQRFSEYHKYKLHARKQFFKIEILGSPGRERPMVQ